MKVTKRIISLIMIVALLIGVIAMSTISPSASGTGVGLAEWAMRAYNEGWSYVWGGDSVGAVDCSGMITSYCGGNRTSMLADAQENGRDWGYVSDGIPNIHGLGLSRPNHVGVYVGNGMEVDARGDDYGVCYQAVGSRWNCWFKLTAVTYPTTGWQKFNGEYYYYENGEYLADTARTIDGVTYYFASSGVSSENPSSVSTPKSSASTTVEKKPVVDNGPLKKGSVGERVEKLQARLQELGYYNGAVDGDFGQKTEEAFKLFQKQAGLYEDGIAGSDADYLYADDAPAYVAPVLTVTPSKKETASTGANLSTSVTAESPVTADNDDHTGDPAPADRDQAEDTNTQAEIEASKEATYASGDSGDAVASVQLRLIELGYLEGDADGVFGAMTETAVKSFQAANHLEESGIVDSKSYEAIFSPAAVKNAEASSDSSAPIQPAAITAATTAKDTSLERDTVALSQQSVAAVSESIAARRSSSTNIEFIVWLGIMIIVMGIAFTIVYKTEKKRSGRMAYVGRRFQ